MSRPMTLREAASVAISGQKSFGGRKFHAGLDSLERNDHALLVRQLHSADATYIGAAAAHRDQGQGEEGTQEGKEEGLAGRGARAAVPGAV